MNPDSFHKGRGAQQNPDNKFLQHRYETRDDFLEYMRAEGEDLGPGKTQYLPIFPKTIVNKVTSPDVGMNWSLNPYQGCEHGCIYCYARNSHEYWGYSAGLDFETRILVKENAPALLEDKLRSKNWKAETIVLSGNTDCYQPAEEKFRLTRACLEIFLKYRHPVGIITKNSRILQDLDLLKELAAHKLVGVNISVTSLSEQTRRILEPRTATIAKRLQAIQELSDNNIPVNAMLAPIIPGINSHEALPLAKAVADHGARSFSFTVVRLNGAIGQIFTDWIRKAMPDKADKVLHQIAECHGGSLNDSRFGLRNKGDGILAKQIHDMVKLAKKQYFQDRSFPPLDNSLHHQYKKGQLSLF
ncbi:PA0069 family radical SAM protein [Zeaxanthinibacter sp. PT1]|uniref:PA0069 family radical SAM protein n=1 Tax=Zeaxanthinibacter TaxID=561554 RepID=UPI00234BA4DA|nr:PA0069 family radical SAM protein [Zeaxanthinibacter sp. PT1]MDC6350436.1 PA0069 family radical SAM protein [Zeaxanthinibacter sp. PT1]